MPSLLRNAAVTDAQRREHDSHRAGVVLLVLSVLLVYMYLFTHVADPLGAPRPQELAERLGISIDHVFDSDRNVDSTVGITHTQRFDRNDDERLVLLLVLVGAFLGAYYLPLRYKQHHLVAATVAALWLLYGPRATTGLLFTHLVIYLVLHPRRQGHGLLCAVAGLLAWWAFLREGAPGPSHVLEAAAAAAVSLLAYRLVLLPLLGVERLAPKIRTLVVQSALLTVLTSAFIEGASGLEWSLPLGVLLFFWQWERLMMYHVDYKDGLVPDDPPLGRYLAVFLNPGVVPNWNWGVTIGQGYAYTQDNFLCEDKNRLVLSGVKLLVIALVYLVFGDWIRHRLVDLLTDLGVPVHRAYTKNMVRHFVRGGEVSTASVLCTTFLDLVRWTMLWAGVVHFKVGVWRICGYRVDPYIHRPWASTNLAVLWSRFTFHYREFLVRCFYYPVFFRFFKKNRTLRILTATMAAAAVGNLVWGHIPERMFYRGMVFENLLYVLGTWPYFVLLGAGIGVSHLYLVWRKRTRKPWTLDRWIWSDVLAAYCTLQYYALIHIFARPVQGSTPWDLGRLLLKAFGIHIS